MPVPAAGRAPAHEEEEPVEQRERCEQERCEQERERAREHGREHGDGRRDPVRAREERDAGMATAEYAVATLAACGFAGLLVAVLRSDEVRRLLLGVVRQALALG
ncbi:DUF4244 domain-containing protein [Kineococcus sp. SYSU DK005]|uniref:DUF4244 domain-containing protein n=1 Tax=Kineococcus sp. SYSU DK005 TaxID=3383126 RepID=UPI003D7C8FE2